MPQSTIAGPVMNSISNPLSVRHSVRVRVIDHAYHKVTMAHDIYGLKYTLSCLRGGASLGSFGGGPIIRAEKLIFGLGESPNSGAKNGFYIIQR